MSPFRTCRNTGYKGGDCRSLCELRRLTNLRLTHGSMSKPRVHKPACQTQNPVIARSCGFDPLRRHSRYNAFYGGKLIKSYKQRIRTIAHEKAQIHNLFVNNSSTNKTVTAPFGGFRLSATFGNLRGFRPNARPRSLFVKQLQQLTRTSIIRYTVAILVNSSV